jgi:hypothetical protein
LVLDLGKGYVKVPEKSMTGFLSCTKVFGQWPIKVGKGRVSGAV